MLFGYLLSGVTGGVVAAAGAVVLGHTALIAMGLYSLCGIMAMVGFGLCAGRGNQRA